MTIFLGADHRGFRLKEQLKNWLIQQNFQVVDHGNHQLDPQDDFPDFALPVAQVVAQGRGVGILLCGSAGMTIVANKFKGVRAAEVWNPESARHAKAHDHANLIQLPADFINLETAQKIVQVWLTTPEDQSPTILRRLEKINKIEAANFK